MMYSYVMNWKMFENQLDEVIEEGVERKEH
jgi:hypothetical protein